MHIAHYSKTLYSTVAKATDLPPLLGWFTNGLNFVIVSCRPVIELFYPPINLSKTIQNLSRRHFNQVKWFMYICVINDFSAKWDFSPFFLSFPFKTLSNFFIVFAIDSIQFVTISFVYVKKSPWQFVVSLSIDGLKVGKSCRCLSCARAPVVFLTKKYQSDKAIRTFLV